MGLEKKNLLISLLPVGSLVIACGAVSAYLLPWFAPLFMYERRAILRGEFWRLLTSHLVHFDLWHLGYNLSALLMAGLVTALAVYLALCTIKEAPAGRLGGWVFLGLLVVKMAFEYATSDSCLFFPSDRSFQPMWESHALGGLAAGGLFVIQKSVRMSTLNGC